MLGFERKEEAGGETVDHEYAGRPAGGFLQVGQVFLQQVAVEVAGDVVEDGEEEPGHVEAGREHHHHPQPGGVCKNQLILIT